MDLRNFGELPTPSQERVIQQREFASINPTLNPLLTSFQPHKMLFMLTPEQSDFGFIHHKINECKRNIGSNQESLNLLEKIDAAIAEFEKVLGVHDVDLV